MLRSYIKIALVVFARRKLFTAISLMGITFTLAILLIATAVLDHIFGGAPPEVNQGRTLGVFTGLATGGRATRHSPLSWTVLNRCLSDLPGAERVSLIKHVEKVTSFAGEQRVESFLKLTDAEIWEILEFDFLEGRGYTDEEVASGAAVAVINRATRDRFFASGSAVGQMIETDGRRYQVIGVVDNVPFFRLVPFADIWAPMTTDESYRERQRVLGSYMGIILAHSRADFAQIRDEVAARLQEIDLSVEGDYDTLYAVPESPFALASRMIFAQGRTVESHAGSLLMLVIFLMVLFMILPTVNLVNLNISRIMERASEIGVRKAFGASSFTLVGQLVVENVLLTLGGSLLALVLASFALDIFSATGLIPYARFHINLRVFIYGVLTALAFGLLSGVYPAWRMSRMHPVEALRGGASW